MENNYDNPLTSKMKSPRFKMLSVVATILLFLIFICIWIYGHSYINIDVKTDVKGEFSYELVEQNSKKTTSISSESKNIKKLVKKGTYEVVVKNGDENSFSIKQTKSFLRTNHVEATLNKESERSFIGDNPDPCMSYDQKILITYACGANYGDASAHMPASQETPTTTENIGGDLSEIGLGGIINSGGKRLAYLEGHFDAESTEEERITIEVNDKFKPVNRFELKGDLSEGFHQIINYKDGFIIHNRELSDILYYKDPSSAPEKISMSGPEDTELAGQQLAVDGDRISAYYTNSDRELDSKEGKTVKDDGVSYVKVYENGDTRSFDFKGSYYLAQVCAEKYLCLLQNRELTIYDISGKKAKEKTKISNVYSLKNVGTTLKIVRYDGVLDFDLSKMEGHLQYSFGGYTPCGIETTQNGYVLCVISPKNDKHALYIDNEKKNVDDIDKKMIKLRDMPFIDDVSIYKSYIYITPELGEPEYNETVNGYVPNPVIKQKANKDINAIITELGIDRSRYTVINTQP